MVGSIQNVKAPGDPGTETPLLVWADGAEYPSGIARLAGLAPMLNPQPPPGDDLPLNTLRGNIFHAQVVKPIVPTGTALPDRNTLWFALTQTVNENAQRVTRDENGEFPANARNAATWYEHDLGLEDGGEFTAPQVQAGTLRDRSTETPESFCIPSVAASAQGNMLLGCTGSGEELFPSVAISGHYWDRPSGHTDKPAYPTLGDASYLRSIANRPPPPRAQWGDYSVTSVDPLDGQAMWTWQEYCREPLAADVLTDGLGQWVVGVYRA